jgi:hypothetical protein
MQQQQQHCWFVRTRRCFKGGESASLARHSSRGEQPAMKFCCRGLVPHLFNANGYFVIVSLHVLPCLCFPQAYSLAGMGCGAGVIGIHLVRDILQAHPGANALFICAGEMHRCDVFCVMIMCHVV